MPTVVVSPLRNSGATLVCQLWYYCGGSPAQLWCYCGVSLCQLWSTVVPLWYHCGGSTPQFWCYSGVQLWPPMVLLLTLVFYCAPVVSPLCKYIATLVCTVVLWYYCGVSTVVNCATLVFH